MKGHFQSKDSARTPHPAQLTSEEENPHLPAQVSFHTFLTLIVLHVMLL